MENRSKSDMPKFSTYLKKLFENSGESISSVARSIGAERTSIHKALNGERQLPYPVVRALADHFQLSLEERQEFFRLYDILLQGETVWQNRTAVSSLLNYLSAFQFQTATIPTTAVTPPPISENIPVQGELAVLNRVNAILYYEILQNDHAVFRLFLPSNMDLSQIFISQWLSGRKFDVQQLFCISSVNSDSSVKNVQLLRQIIPQSLVSRESYRPFRFYENVGSSFINPLNYYIITPHYLILLKKDLSVAYIQQNESLIDVYSDHFRALMEHCEPLVFLAASVEDLFDISNSLIDPNGNLYLMSEPCFGRYYTPEFVTKYYKAENSPLPTMAEDALRHSNLLQSVEKNFYTVFSEKGLHFFVETGIVDELPPEYVSAADVKDRIYLLTRLRNDIASGKVTGLVARPSSLRLPDYLTLSMDSSGNAYFDTTSTFPRGAFYCNIHISEKSICQAFRDFFTSLPGSQLVYSKEETLKMLDEGIRKLGGKSPLPG